MRSVREEESVEAEVLLAEADPGDPVEVGIPLAEAAWEDPGGREKCQP